MKDVQKQIDGRDIYLNQVGIKGFVVPMEFRNKNGDWISTAATVSLFVGLDAKQKGTHMSRFVGIIQENRRMDLNHVKKILQETKEKLEADSAFVMMKFEYFIEKTAPVSGMASFFNVGIEYSASLTGDEFEFDMKVTTPVTTLCPCSKEISEYGAHNQRADVSIKIKMKKFLWIEDLVEIAEDSASAPVYSLLKRPDEKYVTEHAYDNPRFVEDVCREVKLRVSKLKEVENFCIEVESQESIHNHSAYAMVVG